MKDINIKKYITPELVMVTIEVEQAILSASVENIGERKEDIDW